MQVLGAAGGTHSSDGREQCSNTLRWKKRNYERYYESAAMLYSKGQGRLQRFRRRSRAASVLSGAPALSALDGAAVDAAMALSATAADEAESCNGVPAPDHLKAGSAYVEKGCGGSYHSERFMRERAERVLRRQQQDHLERLIVEANMKHGAQQEEEYGRELDVVIWKAREELTQDTQRTAQDWVNFRWQQTVEEYEELTREDSAALQLADRDMPTGASPQTRSPRSVPQITGGGEGGEQEEEESAPRPPARPVRAGAQSRRRLVPLPIRAVDVRMPDVGTWTQPKPHMRQLRRAHAPPDKPALNTIRHQVSCMKVYAVEAHRTGHLEAMHAMLPPGYSEQVRRSRSQQLRESSATPHPTEPPTEQQDHDSGSELGAEEKVEAAALHAAAAAASEPPAAPSQPDKYPCLRAAASQQDRDGRSHSLLSSLCLAAGDIDETDKRVEERAGGKRKKKKKGKREERDDGSASPQSAQSPAPASPQDDASASPQVLHGDSTSPQTQGQPVEAPPLQEGVSASQGSPQKQAPASPVAGNPVARSPEAQAAASPVAASPKTQTAASPVAASPTHATQTAVSPVAASPTHTTQTAASPVAASPQTQAAASPVAEAKMDQGASSPQRQTATSPVAASPHTQADRDPTAVSPPKAAGSPHQIERQLTEPETPISPGLAKEIEEAEARAKRAAEMLRDTESEDSTVAPADPGASALMPVRASDLAAPRDDESDGVEDEDGLSQAAASPQSVANETQESPQRAAASDGADVSGAAGAAQEDASLGSAAGTRKRRKKSDGKAKSGRKDRGGAASEAADGGTTAHAPAKAAEEDVQGQDIVDGEVAGVRKKKKKKDSIGGAEGGEGKKKKKKRKSGDASKLRRGSSGVDEDGTRRSTPGSEDPAVPLDQAEDGGGAAAQAKKKKKKKKKRASAKDELEEAEED